MSVRKKVMIRFEKRLAEKLTTLAAQRHTSVNALVVKATEEMVNSMYTMDEEKDFLSVILEKIVEKQLHKFFKAEAHREE